MKQERLSEQLCVETKSCVSISIRTFHWHTAIARCVLVDIDDLRNDEAKRPPKPVQHQHNQERFAWWGSALESNAGSRITHVISHFNATDVSIAKVQSSHPLER